MQDKIEILDTALLENKSKLKEIDHWLKVFNWPNGWHYDLDIIWVLNNIERLNLPKGSTIIDAGAGIGMTQFILASRGYNVISLDFTKRQIPRFAKGIFNIESVDTALGDYQHEYMSFMTHGQSQPNKPKKSAGYYFSKLRKLFYPGLFLRNVHSIMYQFMQYVHTHFNVYYALEKQRDHSSFGKITFLRGTFNNIPLENNAADALVSVSAFEHNTYEDMPGSISEFKRVLKPHAPMFISTSASDNQDWYFNPPKAWNFSKQTLSSWFNIPNEKIAFDYKKVLENIKNSKILKKRMSPYYKLSVESALPYGNLKEAKYLPVGILKIKE
ncbi:MAG: methyltransferase domain-containing protein [Elusimicrobia bacterium]|nr:methyltransferase domain-containing protein [Elusimicrobiota bacterium]